MDHQDLGSSIQLNTNIKVEDNTFTVPPHWFWNEYNTEGLEPDTLATFKKYINSSTHFIDIGAWLGVTSLYAISCGCKKINAVEANPKSYSLITNMIELNNLQDAINTKNICISDKNNQTVKFGIDTSSASRISDAGQYTVQTQLLTSYINEIKTSEYKDLFVKIDIEGAESLIIDQIDKLIKDYSANIFLALHPPFWKDKKITTSLIQHYFKDKNISLSDGDKISINKLNDMLLSKNKYPRWGTKFGNFFEILINE